MIDMNQCAHMKRENLEILAADQSARIAELERDVADLTHDVGRHMKIASEQIGRIADLERALRKYGHHMPECDYMVDTLPCTCGFSGLMDL